VLVSDLKILGKKGILRLIVQKRQETIRLFRNLSLEILLKMRGIKEP